MARKMPNKDYWKKRMEILEDSTYQQSAEYYKDVQEQFRRAINDIQLDIELWYQRLSDNNGISYAAAKRMLKAGELEEFHWTVEEYIKAGEESALNKRWIKELENASARHHISYLDTMKFQIQQHVELLTTEFEGGMADFLAQVYSDRYTHTAYEIVKGTGIGNNLAQIDSRTIEKVLKMPWARDGASFSDRIWSNKSRLVNSLHSELAQSIIKGASPQQAIDSLTRTMNVSRTQAGRLIMTESAAIASAAQHKCLKGLGIESYEILATLDNKTSEICRELDGKVFDMKDYEVGITAPPFHPNCRSTTVPCVDEEFVNGEGRAARGDDGQTYYVPGDLTYKQWKAEYNPLAVAVNQEKHYNDSKMKLSFPDDISKIKGVTPDVKGQLDAAIHNLEDEYDIRLKMISVEPAGKGDIFITGWYDGGMGMVVNQDVDFDRVQESIQARYKAGIFAGKSLEDYIAHEMLHVLVYQDCKTQQQYRAKFMQIESLYESLQGISGYADGTHSGNEALAEAFVRIRNGEEVPAIVRVLVESYVGRWRK